VRPDDAGLNGSASGHGGESAEDPNGAPYHLVGLDGQDMESGSLDSAAVSASQRAAVVAEARSWIRTPYHHAADVKGHGVDCAFLLIRVYCDLGLVDSFDPRPYTRDWFLHRDEERYLGFLLARSHEVSEPGLGDIILFRMGRCFAHAGIVSQVKPLRMIHAFAPSRCVVEDIIESNTELSSRMKTTKFASYWGA
jgi:cell wall-associated NlpC family hydrolase